MALRPCSVPALLIFFAAATNAAQKIEVTGVRAFSRTDSTRVVVDLSGQADYRADRFHEPERLIVDVLNARTWISHRRFATQPVGDALVQDVRVAETTPDVTRIVLDLNNQVSYRVTRSGPTKLIIEVEPVAPGSNVTERIPEPADPPVVSSARPGAQLGADPAKGLPARKPATALTQPEDSTGSMTRALGLSIRRIVIDAGHGGQDDGTMGRHGVREKDVVLDVALHLAQLIKSRTDIDVVMTRSTDVFVPLQQRTKIANESRADLFLSIHANSSALPSAAGTETYYLSLTNSRSELDVAARENAYGGGVVSDLNDLVRAITISDKTMESQAFARTIEQSISARTMKTSPSAQDRGVKRAPFVVLIGASMPTALAELGFLSNSADESNLGNAAYRRKMAEALFLGITEYADSLGGVKIARKMSTENK